MTFSIAARCVRSGQFGLAVASSSPAVAARCSHVCSSGAVASQNITDPMLGIDGLKLLESGMSARSTLDALLQQAGSTAAYRQLTVLDHAGDTAAHSGAMTLGIHAVAPQRDAVAAGNMLKHDGVPGAMVDRFGALSSRSLAERLIEAMRAGLESGGEAGPIHSIGLKIVGTQRWPIADLRVDWHDTDPLGELYKLWAIYGPQMNDYVTRAVDPTKAPSFGVPGDER